jgi:hypothetical protein
MRADDTPQSNPGSASAASTRARKRGGLWAAGLAILALAGAICARFVGQAHAEKSLARTTLEAAVPRSVSE